MGPSFGIGQFMEGLEVALEAILRLKLRRGGGHSDLNGPCGHFGLKRDPKSKKVTK